MTNDDGDAIVERFRAAAMGMIDWSDALTAMTSVTRARVGQLAALDDRGNLMFSMVVGCSDDEQAAYFAAGGPDPAINPRTRALTMARPLRCITDNDFITQPMRERSAIYTGLFRESDVPICAMVRLETADDSCAALGMHRSASRGLVEPDEFRFIDALAPAISAVVKASMTLGSSLNRTSLVTAESLSGAAVLLGESMTIVAVSPDAERFLRRGDPLTMRRGRLFAACRHAMAKLERAFACVTADSADWQGAVPLTFPDGGRSPPLTADLCPLPRRTSGPLSGARALLVLRLPRGSTEPGDTRLMAVFGLTPSEAEIARLLVTGVPLAGIATRRRTSLATVRSQLKSIFGKTGCNRQVDLSILMLPYCGSAQ